MRNIIEVIDQIKETIPEKVDTSQLDKIKESVAYTAPEAMGMRWNELAYWLNSTIMPPLAEDWQVKVVSIFTTWTEDEVRLSYAS